jgi:glutathione synthase
MGGLGWVVVGNNIYGADVSTTLRELQKDEEQQGLLAAYILMQRMFPTISSSYLLRNGIWSLEDTVSELGIFGTYLRSLPPSQHPVECCRT